MWNQTIIKLKIKQILSKMHPVIILIKSIIAYTLILFYNFQVLFGIGLLFIFKNKSEFWIPKSRPDPPKCLTDKEHGEHRFVVVNVSDCQFFLSIHD